MVNRPTPEERRREQEQRAKERAAEEAAAAGTLAEEQRRAKETMIGAAMATAAVATAAAASTPRRSTGVPPTDAASTISPDKGADGSNNATAAVGGEGDPRFAPLPGDRDGTFDLDEAMGTSGGKADEAGDAADEERDGRSPPTEEAS